MKIDFVQDALYLGTILKCPQADHVRCCGVSVSSVTGEVSSEFSSPSLVRISKSVASDSNEETTDVNLDSIASTTEGNLLDSPTTTELGESTENFPGDAFTTEPSVNEMESTTENEIATTESATEVVHHDGEIIDNVMIFYPSEMSGKPHAKPEDMPVDVNEFRIHDDIIGTDLHLIYPTNSTSTAVKTQTTEAIEATTIKIITPSVESATPTDAPKAKISVVTPSQESHTSDVPSTETLTSPTETTDLKPEESELANQIENTNKPRYKRRKLKRKPFLKTSTTKKVPTEATTPIPAYKLQSRYRNSPVKTNSDTEAKSGENPPPTTTEKSSIVDETTTRRAHLQYLKLYRSRNHPPDAQPLMETTGEVANEHELKISALHGILMETANASSVHNLTDFLIQRQQSEQQLNARRNILSSYRTTRPNDLSIASRTSTTTLTAIQSTEADTTTETATEARTTTESDVSAPVTSLRERFSRRRIPLQLINRVQSSAPSTPTKTTTEISTTTTFVPTTPSDIQPPLKGVRGILRRRRPTTRAPSIELNAVMTAESVTPEHNVQKIRRRTKIDRMSSSKRKLMESLQRKRPASTTESSFVDPLLVMLQRKRLKTTTTERSVTSNPTRKYRRRKTTTTTTTTTEATAATAEAIAAKSSEEVQSVETSSVEPIEITTTTTESTTTTPIPTEVYFQPTKQPSFVEIEPGTEVNNAAIHPIPAPKEYTEIRRPHASTSLSVEEQLQKTEFKPPTPLLTKTATFPDMRLPSETMEPFHREPADTKIFHRETIISPQSTPSQLISTNHVGQSSSPSEAFMRPLQTLLPTSRHPVNFLPPTAPFPQHGEDISPIHSSHRFAINPNQHIPSAQPHPPRYFINANQNGALANHHYHRFAMPNFNAGQSQQQPVPYIDHTNPYIGQMAPFGHYNLRYNFN